MARCPCARYRQDVTPIDAQQTVHSLGDLRLGLSHLKLSKPAKQRRLSLRDTFKKKRKIISAKLFNQWYRVQIWLSWWGSAAFTRWVHPSSLFLITFIDFTRIFSPQKGKSSLLVCRAVEVQTPHFSFSEVWKWNIHDYTELSLRESGESEMKMEKKTVVILIRHSNFHGVPALF